MGAQLIIKRMNTYHYLLKFILIGDSGVGKSCIVLQFIENKTRKNHEVTIGVEFGAKQIFVRNKDVKLQIWDTAGQENFRSITRSYYRTAIGALLVYDITRRHTFEHVRNWLEEARNHGNPYMQVLLIGNKSDLWDERTVKAEEGEDLAAQFGIGFIEVSAKDYHKVEAAFKKLAETIVTKIEQNQIPIDHNFGIRTGDYKSDNQKLADGDADLDLYGCC